MKRMNPTLAILALLVLAGCGNADANRWAGTITDSAGVAMVANPADGDWSLRAAPVLEQDLDIGTAAGEPAYQFGQVVAIDVNDRGDVYVLDSQAAEVRVFDASGRHLRTMGKRGGGPGEFSQMTMFLQVGAGDTVFVADVMGQRLARLGPDGVETGSYPLNFAAGLPLRWQVAPDGRFAVQLRKLALPNMVDTTAAPDRVILRDITGTQADTILELEAGGTMQMGAGGMRFRMFEPEPIWALLQDGRMVRARSNAYRLEVLRPDGTLERVITRPATAKPVEEADRQAILNLLEGAWKQAGVNAQQLQMLRSAVSFASHYPVFGNISPGPGNTIWVQRVLTAADVQLEEGEEFQVEDINSPDWDVFDEQGRLLGMVTLPAGFVPLRVTADAIYGRMADELDVQHVVRIRVR